MDTIDVDGAAIAVEIVGDGPVALVLHGGLGVDHQMYRSLDRLGEHLRLVYVDHRGNGRSTGDATTATMQQWAADATEVARQVGDGGPVIVIGHSYGGFIAQEMMLAHPDSVRAAVLVTTTPGQLGTGEEPAPDGPPMPEEFAAMFANMPETDEEYKAFQDRLAPAYVHRLDPAVLREAMHGTVFRADAMRRGFEVLAGWSAVDRLAGVGVPVLLIAGRHDAFCAWPQSERIARKLADVETVVFEHSGHVPWLEEREGFFDAVTGWLERRSLVPSTSD
jgi:proline iminopeptidase